MDQYIKLGKRILDEGHMIRNDRTGKGTLTVINADLEYDVANNKFPLVTTRKTFWKAAIAELLGYLRGYDSAEQFRAIGCNTWNANANDNDVWLANPYRKGEDDMGAVYGVQGRRWDSFEFDNGEWAGNDTEKHLEKNGYVYVGDFRNYSHGETPMDDIVDDEAGVYHKQIDQLMKVYENLKKGIDDRGEIITFWNPAAFHKGCLRPCMHTHTFSLLGDTLYLTSYQRSCDVPLGLTFNSPQVFVFLALMARVTGHKAGTAFHKIINAHIYEDQIDGMKEQMTREPFAMPELRINPKIKTMEDLLTWVTVDDFEVVGYEHHEPIKYAFSV